MTKPTVEIRMAFEWTCENCGRDNFARAVPATRKQVEEAFGEHELAERDGREGYCTYPDDVKCPHCGAEYAAAYEESDDDEAEPD